MSDDKIRLVVDEDDFTIGDLEDFEEITGESLESVLQGEVALDEDGNKKFDEKGRPLREMKVSAKVVKALVYIIRRREVPGFTLEDARNVKLSSIEWADSSEPDPKDESASVSD